MISEKVYPAVIMAFLLIVVACSSITGEDDPLPDTGDGDLPPRAVLQAMDQLSDSLGVDVQNIEIVEVEQMDWPDACLGLANEGEVCAQVITPGFRVVFEVGGQQYVFRTDREGEVIRRVPEGQQ